MNIKFTVNVDKINQEVKAGQLRSDGECVVLVIDGHFKEDEAEDTYNTVIIHALDDYFEDIVLNGLNEPFSSIPAEEVYKEFPIVLNHSLHIGGPQNSPYDEWSDW